MALGKDDAPRGITTILLALTMVTVAGAGCLGDDTQTDPLPDEDDDQQDADDQGPTVLPWGLTGCEVVVAIVPVDSDALSEHLPDGFSPLSAEEAFGLPQDPRGEGALGLETFDCPNATGLNGTLEDIGYASIFAPVQPPEGMAWEEVDIHFYKWETLVPDQDRRELLAARGLPALDGSVDLSGLQVTPAGHLFDVSMTLGEDTYTFSGSASAPNQDFRDGLPFVEFQNATGGMATWSTLTNNATDANSGSGTVGLPAGSWTAELVGAEETQAYMVASTDVSFGQAEIRLP